jgi:hypothetical protein
LKGLSGMLEENKMLGNKEEHQSRGEGECGKA